MIPENAYAFRQELDTVHRKGRRNPALLPDPTETEITDEWNIVIAKNASAFIRAAAEDLADYFKTSMDVEIGISTGTSKKGIILETSSSEHGVKRSFCISCDETQIRICGFDERGAAMGAYYIEDVMNLREAPFCKHCTGMKKEPLFSPRIVHSGYALDIFTPNYLRRIAHYGFDAITLYTGNEDKLDFNEIIENAALAGLDVYFYSKFKNTLHPRDNGTEEFYDGIYGALCRRYPKAGGIIFVGESCRFPSRDPQTTMTESTSGDGIPSTKPNPGFWPCSDYHELIALFEKIIHANSPDMDIIFWTYNWGYAPEKKRLDLIDSLPENISVEVNFALHDKHHIGGTVERALDYTLGPAGPSGVFRGEAAAVKRNGLRLYTMSNTGGRTWDFGVIPYIPAPFQWLKRYEGLLRSHDEYGLSGLMESHHYGWQPSYISELAKWCFWSEPPDMKNMVRAIAVRDFSEAAADAVLSAWREWSTAVAGFITPIEDQYGPCRVGPAYPFIFSPDLLRSMYGKFMTFPRIKSNIVFPWYRPVDDPNGAEIAVKRLPAEIKYLPEIIDHWQRGIDLLENIMDTVPEQKKAPARKQINLGRFIRNTIKTTLHIKKWWLLNSRLLLEDDKQRSFDLLDQMESLLSCELENVNDTIPLVIADSSLGYECAMDYVCDEWHLNWKKRQISAVLEYDIPKYRETWN